jgi:hypothetical protein
MFHRLGDLPYPQRPEEIAPIMRTSFEAFDRDREFVRAYFSTELGRTARSRGRPRRIEAIRAALRPLTDGLDEQRRTEVEAVVAYLASIQAWITMQDEFGLSGEGVGRAITWAINTLLNDLRAQQSEQQNQPQSERSEP